MTTLEAIMKQQELFNKMMPKNNALFDTALQQRAIIDKLLPKNLIDLKSQMAWVEKINNMKPVIPKGLEYLNFSNMVFDNSLAKMAQNLKWVQEFQQQSKVHNLFEGFFKIGQNYKLVDWDFAKLFEWFEEPIPEDKNVDDDTQHAIIITETRRVKDIIREIYLNNIKLFTIKPREFEKIVAELLYNQGFEVELTKQTRDNGYDILALKYIDGFSPIKYLVECKRYDLKRKIGVEIIRSFKEVIATEQANRGIIVTSSYFTMDAIKKQKETPYLLEYKDKDAVINWVNDYMHKVV